jgi:hypothetical protein
LIEVLSYLLYLGVVLVVWKRRDRRAHEAASSQGPAHAPTAENPVAGRGSLG